jgi:hypothetical protein
MGGSAVIREDSSVLHPNLKPSLTIPNAPSTQTSYQQTF